jgi:hypothetical protein
LCWHLDSDWTQLFAHIKLAIPYLYSVPTCVGPSGAFFFNWYYSMPNYNVMLHALYNLSLVLYYIIVLLNITSIIIFWLLNLIFNNIYIHIYPSTYSFFTV